jgi:hypothetical protein
MLLQQYEDELTVKAVVAAAEVLQLSVDVTLRELGGAFGRHVAVGEQARRLRAMGDSTAALIKNVNSLHNTLEASFPHSTFPVFAVDMLPDGAFRVSYTSVRGALLAPVFEGVLSSSAEALYGERLTLTRRPELCAVAAVADMVWEVSVCRLSGPERDAVLARDATSAEHARSAASWHAALMPCRGTRLAQAPWQLALKTPDDLRLAAALRYVERDETVRRRSSGGSVVEHDPARSTPRMRRETAGDWPARFSSAWWSRAWREGQLSMLRYRLDHELTIFKATTIESSARGPVDRLIRGVAADFVCADWSDVAALERTSKLWRNKLGKLSDYQLSRRQLMVDVFVSHVWKEPPEWKRSFGRGARYADIKVTALCHAMRAHYGDPAWREATLFNDKFCTPQEHDLKLLCIRHLDEFAMRCDRLLVILAPHYFTRLWCCVEWAAFLILHEPSQVSLVCEAFMHEGMRAAYVDQIEHFSVAHADCHDPADRSVLLEAVRCRYTSSGAFERYVRATAVALVAVEMARSGSHSSRQRTELFLPWVQLAERLGEAPLAATLSSPDILRWRIEAVAEAAAASAAPSPPRSRETSTRGITERRSQYSSWQTIFGARVLRWCEAEVYPCLDEIKRACVRPELLSLAIDRAKGTNIDELRKKLNAAGAHAPKLSVSDSEPGCAVIPPP